MSALRVSDPRVAPWAVLWASNGTRSKGVSETAGGRRPAFLVVEAASRRLLRADGRVRSRALPRLEIIELRERNWILDPV